MMKKFIFLILLLFINCLFYSGVLADSNIVLDNPVISFKKIKKYNLQGYTVVNNKLFMILEGYDDTKSIIKVYDLDTYQEIVSYNYGSLGHANDVTYNKNTNKIYVLASSGSDEIFIFNGDTFEYEKSINIGLPVRSITYLYDMNMYAVRTVTAGFIYNSDFVLENNLPFVVGMNFSSELGRQGWTYYKDLIYYANWSWVKAGGDGANIIYVYDLKGNKLSNIYTDKNIGEIEGVDFYNNKMLLGFNGYDDNINFYLTDIPKVEIPKEEVAEAPIVKKKNYNIYIFIGIGCVLFVLVIIFIIFRHKKKVS